MSQHQADLDLPAPKWPTCNHSDNDATCSGRRVDGYDRCLAHINDQELDQALAQLRPGAALDASGTSISADLLSRILSGVKGIDGTPIFGNVSFTQAHFDEEADFRQVKFDENASFDNAIFGGATKFTGSKFNGDARFSRTQFDDESVFSGAIFSGAARFGGAQFGGSAIFQNVQFLGHAVFGNAKFSRSANFNAAHFGLTARFFDVQFSNNIWFIAAKFDGSARFDGAHFVAAARFQNAQFAFNAAFTRAQFSGAAAFVEARFDKSARFDRVQFNGDTIFRNASFGGEARFDGSILRSYGVFDGIRFRENVSFDRTKFERETMFRGVQFVGGATFRSTGFNSGVAFDRAQFSADGAFDRAHFQQDVTFDRTRFHNGAIFDDATFDKATLLAPFSANDLSFRRTVFDKASMIDAAAANIACQETVWRAGVTLRLRYAAVDLERATLTMPSFVSGYDRKFQSAAGELEENQVRRQIVAMRGESPDLWMPVLLSVRGADAFNLTVTDIDLSQCRFAGARILDQLRLEGRCIFDRPPNGFHVGWTWPLIWKWSNRQSLTEERIWRATTSKHSGWAPNRSSAPAEIRPERLAGLYRQLRKAQEDAKNEPGAADLYYGEMEMRKLSRTTPVAERGILLLYWLLSGYGLRAFRSLGALIIVGLIITIALIGWGLGATAPDTIPPQRLTGTITTVPHKPAQIGAVISETTTELPPPNQRWTSERTQTALEVTFESFVFRNADQPLTSAGTWITIIARIFGPVLFALTLLAVRNRVKR